MIDQVQAAQRPGSARAQVVARELHNLLARKDTKGGRTAKTEPTQKTHETVTSHKMSEDKSTKGQDAGMAKPTHVALRYPPRRAMLPVTRSLDDRVQTLAITPPHSSSGGISKAQARHNGAKSGHEAQSTNAMVHQARSPSLPT